MPILDAVSVVTATAGGTHLTGSSPALQGNHPHPTTTLCGATVRAPHHGQIYTVDCGQCLIASQPYWGLPGWTPKVLVP